LQIEQSAMDGSVSWSCLEHDAIANDVLAKRAWVVTPLADLVG
jgi:hypothetical protein